MIFYKKKNKIKKVINYVFKRREINFFSSFKLLKFFSLFLLFILFGLYALYLFFLPKIVDEKNAETIINSYLSKKTKFVLDVENIKISPNYKFDIVLSADKARLKYSKDKDFLLLEKPLIDINLFTLLMGYVDLNSVKSTKIVLNTNFTKSNKYSCFDYIDFSDDKQTKFKLRNLNLVADEFNLNLYDENIKKSFYVKTKKIKWRSNGDAKHFIITTNGVVLSSDLKISDFVLKLDYKLRDKATVKFKDRISKFNYNPFLYADKYKFYSYADINLKFFPSNENQNVVGKINLQDYSFVVQNIRLPKNSTEILFKGDKILFDSDFNLIKNQFIKIKSKINITKNKFIEVSAKSNDIDLADLKSVFGVVLKIFNSKFDMDEIDLKGVLVSDLYLKSNFKTISSSGNMQIKNAKLFHKKTGLVLDKINSDIDFKNNIINIKNTFGNIDSAKFYLNGKIDEKTNLFLDVNSDLINIAQVLSFIKTLPFASECSTFLKNYDVSSGFLKINAKINGNINNPIIKTNSKIQNLKLFSKLQKASIVANEIHIAANPEKYKIKDFSVLVINPVLKINKNIISSPKLNLYIKEKDIQIEKALINFNDIKFISNSIVKNYKTKNPIAEIMLSAKLPANHKDFYFKNKNLSFKSILTYKQNKIHISDASVFENDKKIIVANGEALTETKNGFELLNLKVSILEKVGIVLPSADGLSFDMQGNANLNGKIDKINIDGNLNITNLKHNKFGLSIDDLILYIKNSKTYINIVNGKFFNQNFDLIGECQYKNNSIFIDYVKFVMPYFNASILNQLSFSGNSVNTKQVEISKLEGKIGTLDVAGIQLGDVNLDGSYKNHILNLSNFSSNIFDGTMSGTLKLYSINKKVDAGIILKDIDVKKLSNEIKQFSIAATGKLNTLIDASFVGYEFNDIIKTLDGYIKFNIKNGELSQFAKLERFLQAGNILSQSILKLSLNSTVSALTKQNTGSFETIEGVVKVQNSWVEIKQIKTIGTNMSLYLTGGYNLLNKYCDIKILGRIPTSIVSVLGNIGQFSTSKIVDKMNAEAKNIIETITVSPFEKMTSVQIPEDELSNIPPLHNMQADTKTREFIVFIEGLANDIGSIKYFKWNFRN